VLAWVKLLDQDGNGVACDPTKTSGDRCPVLSIGAQNPLGAPQHRTVGSASSDVWQKDKFNLLKGHFKFFTNELNADALFISITQADVGVNLVLDNVSMLIMKMDTDAPSISPSAFPTVTALPSSNPTISPTVTALPSSNPATSSVTTPVNETLKEETEAASEEKSV